MSNPDSGAERTRTLTDLDRVIHEPGRLALMAHLYVVEEADFLFLLDQTGLTRGNLSSHMTKLEHAGYVDVAKTFVAKTPRTTYRLTAAGRTAFAAYRQRVLRSLEDLPER